MLGRGLFPVEVCYDASVGDPVKITARIEPRRPDTCSFIVDAEVYPDKTALFPGLEAAKGSPLAERLFDLPLVTAVKISGNTVRVTRSTSDDWRGAAKPIADAIRDQIAAGGIMVSPDYQNLCRSDIEIRVIISELLEREINPGVASHGGVVELLDVREGNVFIKMGGGCQGCASASATLRDGVEKSIRKQVPEIDEIFDTTDHAAGANPYYAR